jgi:hypothetical protein
VRSTAMVVFAPYGQEEEHHPSELSTYLQRNVTLPFTVLLYHIPTFDNC